MNGSQNGPHYETLSGIAAKVHPAPAGSLPELATHLSQAGLPCFLAANGSQIWIQGERAEMTRWPIHCLATPDPVLVRSLLRRRGVWLVSYLTAPDYEHRANCFLYACSSKSYRLSDLPGKVRNKVRRGLRSLTIRLITWDELVKYGGNADTEWAARHGYKRENEALRRFADRRRNVPFYDIWGAWNDGELMACAGIYKADDWAAFEMGRSSRQGLRLAANNAIRYVATKYLIEHEKRRTVLSGVSSVRYPSSPLGLHKYKIGMGFDAIPVCRVFLPHWILRPLFSTRSMSRLWDRLAAAGPSSQTLGKVAGMAGLLSKRRSQPLEWAQMAD